jgi:hypothetical protein
MNILKKYFVFVVIFLGSFNVAHANLEITEVMYDPQGANTSHQWIEVYNNGSDSIDLTNWSITDYDTSWHFRSISSDNSTILNSKSYAIIAKTSNLTDFKSKNPNLGGQILKANVTLGAESGHIGLSSDKKNIISEVSYSGAMDNGNSLQKIDNEWKESSPTPGSNNIQSNNNTTENISNNNNTNANTNIITTNISSSNSSTSKISSTNIGDYKVTAKIISPKIVTAGLPFYVSSLLTTNKKETLISGRYVWNFGDGTSSELKSQQELEHIYNYPGEYVLSLSFFNNYFEKIPSSTSRVTIKVISADIVVSSVGQGSDPFIEINNKSNNEIDTSGFIIKGVIHNFTIPVGTIILPGHKLKFSSKITNFTNDDIQSIIVTNQTGEILTSYPQKELPISKNNISSSNSSESIQYSSNKKNNTPNSDSSVINLNDLAAQAGNLESPVNPKSVYVWFGLFGIIAIGIAVIFITRKKNIITPDYLEKEIRAEDMTIIE